MIIKRAIEYGYTKNRFDFHSKNKNQCSIVVRQPPRTFVVDGNTRCSWIYLSQQLQQLSTSLNFIERLYQHFYRIMYYIVVIVLLVHIDNKICCNIRYTSYYWSSHALSTPLPNGMSKQQQQQQLPFNDRTLKVVFVTGNAMKAKEVENIVEEHCYYQNSNDLDENTNMDEIELNNYHDDTNNEYNDDDTCALLQLDLTVTSINLPEIQEVDTIAIAKQKAILAAQLVNGPCVVEDTSLEFHALGGMPGPYIKWFQDTLKSQGLYNILAAYENKNATAKCTLAYIPAPHADPVLFTGICHGHIVEPQPKMYGFGWDTIFVPNEYTIPFSQMSMETKNLVSHRGHAVRQWADWLGQNQDALLQRQYSTTNTFLGHQGLTFKIRPKQQQTESKLESE